MFKKIISILLVLMVTISMFVASGVETFAASYSKTNSALDKTGDYIYSTLKSPSFGSIGGEWAMYGLAIAKYDLPNSYIEKYKKTVEEAVKEGYRGTPGVLHDRKYTEYSRVIIAYSALGLDPTDIAGYNLLKYLADFDKVVWQGINGPIFALRALDSGKYSIPKVDGISNITTRQKLIDYIIKNQTKDGGWNLDNSVNSASDPDITGMALQALAPYNTQSKVKEAIKKAVACLSSKQLKGGGYSSSGTVNSESCAQVISGLLANGINPNADSRFIKNGNSVLDALMSFYDNNKGGFRHVNTAGSGYQPVVNQMATEQAYYALALYFNTVPGKTTISTVTSSKAGAVKVSWKQGKVASGYQIKVSPYKSFTKATKTVYVSGRTAVSKTVTGLAKGKTRYVKVRAYKIINGTKVYGSWSYMKKVKVKK